MDDVELTDMRAEHPEWLLGDQTSEWFALSWNMAVSEVREQRLAHVREMLQYDWDGIELVSQRHLPPYFLGHFSPVLRGLFAVLLRFPASWRQDGENGRKMA